MGDAKEKFMVTLNWRGELHEIYTYATTPRGALRNAAVRLQKKLLLTGGLIRYFDGSLDNYKIVLIKETRDAKY